MIQFDTLICGNHRGLLHGANCIYYRLHLPLVCISPVTALQTAGKTAIIHHWLTPCDFATRQMASQNFPNYLSEWPSIGCFHTVSNVWAIHVTFHCCHLDIKVTAPFSFSSKTEEIRLKLCLCQGFCLDRKRTRLICIYCPMTSKDSRKMTSLLQDRLCRKKLKNCRHTKLYFHFSYLCQVQVSLYLLLPVSPFFPCRRLFSQDHMMLLSSCFLMTL